MKLTLELKNTEKNELTSKKKAHNLTESISVSEHKELILAKCKHWFQKLVIGVNKKNMDSGFCVKLNIKTYYICDLHL